MDWLTIAILASITWLDGLRRVPAKTVILQQQPNGEWKAQRFRDERPGVALVSWWAPIVVPLLLVGDGAIGSPLTHSSILLARCRRRLRRAEPMIIVLRVVGVIDTLSIVFGIPAATSRFGLFGFLCSLCVVIVLSFVITGCSYVMLRRLGLASRSAFFRAVQLLSPFGAPRACEVLYVQATVGIPPLLVTRELLSAEEFTRWIRPEAYDTIHHDCRESLELHKSELLHLLGFEYLESLVSSVPADSSAAELYCPRCGQSYRGEVQNCAECADATPTLIRIT